MLPANCTTLSDMLGVLSILRLCSIPTPLQSIKRLPVCTHHCSQHSHQEKIWHIKVELPQRLQHGALTKKSNPNLGIVERA